MKKRADRTAQLAKRRQAEEIAKQMEIEAQVELEQLDVVAVPAARTGVPGRGMQPLKPGGKPVPHRGKGQVQSR